MITFKLNQEYITLQNLLKAENLVSSGGEAKHMIADGLVKVNRETEIRRGKKLRAGDQIEFHTHKISII